MSCVICQSEIGEGAVLTLPECGHTFHGVCAAQWFRIGSPCCPICRERPQRDVDEWDSDSTSSTWTYVTPAEGHRQVWRLLTPLARSQPRLVRRYRTVWTRLKEHRKNLFHFQRTARGRFRDLKKREGMLKRRMDHLMEIHINLVNELLEAAE